MKTIKRIIPDIVFYITAVFSLLYSGCEERLFPDKANDPQAIFDSFWKEVDRHYSFFDLAGVDWDSMYTLYRPLVNENTSSMELFEIMDRMLTSLKDGHLNIHTPHGVGGNTQYFSTFAENPVVAQPESPYFEYYHVVNRQLRFGKISDASIGYIRIKTFEGLESHFAAIDSLLPLLSSFSGLIIDVRSNYGGNIGNAELIASKFVLSAEAAYQYRIRNGESHSDFTPWYTVNINPSTSPLFGDKIVILTNRGSYSATEWFVLFMDVRPDVIIAGDTTGGGGAIPITRELPNGWILRVPNTQTRLPSGTLFQRVGIPPDIPIWIEDHDESNGVDSILETAIDLF